MSNTDNKRVARNTMYLYIRMGVMMLVRLYTVRIVLEALGVDDYGLWQLLTAFITGFTFIAPTLSTSAQRFLNFDMGRGGKRLTRIFTVSFIFFATVALILVLLLETFGLWFLNTRMHIPPDMGTQANWVFQFMVLTLMADMLRMPYESSIIATERMSFYAWVCIFEAVALLAIVFLLPLAPLGIRFAAYGVLTYAAQTLICLIYVFYTRRTCAFARLRDKPDRTLVREMAGFSGWNILGSMSNAFAVQGTSVLINQYFDLDVNAAYGICLQVHTALFTLMFNISKASSPRIVKDYSEGKVMQMSQLVTWVGKFTFLLVFMLMLPAAFNIDTLLHLWLADRVPPQAALFSILAMCQLLVISFAPPVEAAILATGRIRGYQIAASTITLCNFLFTLILFAMGLPALSTLWVKIGLEILIFTTRLLYVRRADMRPWHYVRHAIAPCVLTAVAALLTMWGIYALTDTLAPLARLVAGCAIFVPFYLAEVWFLALGGEQRRALAARLRSRLSHN